MGTNFYLYYNFCSTCGRGRNRLHLGKSSVGYRFQFQKSDEIRNFEDFKRVINEGTIKDEYGEVWSPKDLVRFIEQGQENYSPTDDKYAIIIDGYDFFEGDFS